MGRRQVVHVKGLGHGQNPIPVAVVVGQFVFTGSISGVDRDDGSIPADIATEVRNAFDNLGAVLSEAGCGYPDVAKVDVSLRDKKNRGHVNTEWLKHFPDEDDRPVRHTTQADLPPGLNIQLEIIAVKST